MSATGQPFVFYFVQKGAGITPGANFYIIMSETKLTTQYNQARSAASSFRNRWDDFIDLAYTKLIKDNNAKSKIRDGSLSSIIYERACRVAAQPASGRIYPLTRHDEGKSQLINLVWDRYCQPRMNSQYPFMTKLRLWEYYSLVFGAMPMLHFYRADNDYVGPDCRLLDPKYVFPQAGRLTPSDCDYIFVEQFFAPNAIKGMKDQEGWDNKTIKEVLDSVKNDTTPDTSEQQSRTQHERDEATMLHAGQVKLVTKYARGFGEKWVTFVPDHGNKIVRTTTNPFQSGRIPVVFKYAMPIIDSFYGLGDVERGESLQRAIDSSMNMGVDYMKIMLFPPTMFPSDANLSQFPLKAGAKWKLTGSGEPKALGLNTSTPGVQQQLYQQFKGAMLNQNGTTDTTIAASDNIPGQGKTPTALKQLESRENARDSWDREMLELAQAELYEGMLEELGIKQSVPIQFEIFEEEIKTIAQAGFTDVLDPFDSAVEYWVGTDVNTGEQVIYDAPSDAEIAQLDLIPKLNGKGMANLTIKPEILVGKYKFNIDTNSTAANNEAEEFERLSALVDFMGTPVAEKAIEALRKSGREFDWGALLERYVKGSNIKGDEKLFRDIPEDEMVEDQQSEQLPPPEETMSEQFNPEMLNDPNLRNVLTKGGM